MTGKASALGKPTVRGILKSSQHTNISDQANLNQNRKKNVGFANHINETTFSSGISVEQNRRNSFKTKKPLNTQNSRPKNEYISNQLLRGLGNQEGRGANNSKSRRFSVYTQGENTLYTQQEINQTEQNIHSANNRKKSQEKESWNNLNKLITSGDPLGQDVEDAVSEKAMDALMRIEDERQPIGTFSSPEATTNMKASNSYKHGR